MKGTLSVMAFIVLLCLLGAGLGAHRLYAPAEDTLLKKNCSGYTVIEAGVGIDCSGDTVRLEKVKGFYKAVSKRDS